MEIVITQWALDSYLDLLSQNVFSKDEYLNIIRPDVMRLKEYPDNEKFNNSKFFSCANDTNGKIIPNGFKMKWHQIGTGLVQLRLTIAMIRGRCFLCEAYVKKDEKIDKRKLSKFKMYLELIRQERYIGRGKLS